MLTWIFHHSKYLFIGCFLLVTTGVMGQDITADLVAKTTLNKTAFFGVDKYGSLYTGDKNTLYKKTDKKTYSYTALQLGELTSVDILNPLKIVLFYEDMNTVVLLDDKLSEIRRVDFNSPSFYRTVKFATEASQNNLWIFNVDAHELELFDYKTKTVTAHTQPVDGTVLQQVSDFNYCWLLSENTLTVYNAYGSFMEQMPADSILDIDLSGHYLLLQRDGRFELRNTRNKLSYRIDMPLQLPVKAFYLMDQNLYLYDGKAMYHYQLNLPN